MIYLDNAATTLVKPAAVGREMLRAMLSCASPGRGGHRAAMRAAELVFRCRERAAELFCVPDPERVVFTMNATHGLNIAIRSLAKAGDRVLISGYEHNAVTRPLHALGVELVIAASPLFDREACLRALRDKIDGVTLCVCTMVSNVFGFILPIREIAALCRERGIPLIVDASQAAGCLPVDFSELGAAFIAMPGHKGLLGPQGTGLLLCGTAGEPLLSGGSGSDSLVQKMPDYLPDRLEAGTQNVPGIAGLLAGIEYTLWRGTEEIMAGERQLLNSARQELGDTPAVELFAGPEGTQSGVLSLRIPGMDCNEAAQQLSEHGICVRSGLHCAPLAHQSADTMETGTIRMSFSPFTGNEELLACCDMLRTLAEKQAEKWNPCR